MTNISILNSSDKIFTPRTPSDFQTLSEWCAGGYSNQYIFGQMENPVWRSDVEEFRGELWCVKCNQKIDLDKECSECGQTYGSRQKMVDYFDSPSDSQLNYLRETAMTLLSKNVSARLTLEIAKALNTAKFNEVLTEAEVISLIEQLAEEYLLKLGAK